MLLLLAAACETPTQTDPPAMGDHEDVPAQAGCSAEVAYDRDVDGVTDETMGVVYAANGEVESFDIVGPGGSVTFSSTWDGDCLSAYTNVVESDTVTTSEELSADCDEHGHWTEETHAGTFTDDEGTEQSSETVVHDLSHDGYLRTGDAYGRYENADQDPTTTGTRTWEFGDDDLVDRYEQDEDPEDLGDLEYVYAYDEAGDLLSIVRTYADRQDTYVEDWDDLGRLLSYGVSEGERTYAVVRGYDGDASVWATEDEDREIDGVTDVTSAWVWNCPE